MKKQPSRKQPINDLPPHFESSSEPVIPLALSSFYPAQKPEERQARKSLLKTGSTEPLRAIFNHLAEPVLVARPSKKDSLPSPAFFAEQVKKLSPLKFLETEEVKRGTDPDYVADPQGVVMRRVAWAVKAQLQDAQSFGGPDEMARLRDVARRARQKKEIVYETENSEEHELYLWFWSFHLCGRWLEAGEKTALINLPHAFSSNPYFFLGQWWVRLLVRGMWGQGEQEKANWLLFGKPRRGKPMIPDEAPIIKLRDWWIHEKVREMTGERVSLYKAYRTVALECEEAYGLRWQTVKKIYLKWERENSSSKDRDSVVAKLRAARFLSPIA